ncbi:hypothetical protein B0H14DRAFT_3173685 [Mycena olivaceomarginata]|nr:hypothetical protein B0H14DRAFT_3173685 [Mycena olivaceomarginata]
MALWVHRAHKMEEILSKHLVFGGNSKCHLKLHVDERYGIGRESEVVFSPEDMALFWQFASSFPVGKDVRVTPGRLLNLNLFGDVLRLLIGFEATQLARSPSSSSTPTHSPPPNRIDHTTLTNNDHSTATRTSLSLPPPTNSAAASAAAAVDQELSLPTWVIFIIIVAIICAALAAFTFVVLPFLRHGHGHGHGHDTDEASDDEDDYVEDVAPPYEEIPLIVIQAPDPSYSPTGRCRVDGDNATSGALKSPPYERVIPIQTRSREHPTPTSVSWPTPVHNDDDDDSSSSEQSLSYFDYDSFPAPPPPVLFLLIPAILPLSCPAKRLAALSCVFRSQVHTTGDQDVPNRDTSNDSADNIFVSRGTDVKVPHLKTLFQRYNQRPGEMRKLQLEEWLIAFSQNEEGWASQLERGARNTHRNPRQGTKSSNLKVSVRRREELITGTDEAGTLLPSRAPTDRSRDNRTAQEVENLIPWVAHLHARHIVQDYPYKTKAERNPTPNPRAPIILKPIARIGFDAFFGCFLFEQPPISLQTHLQQSEVHMKKTTATLNGIQQFLSQFQQQSPFGPTVVDDPPVSAEPPSPNAQRLSTLEELPADPFSRVVPHQPSRSWQLTQCGSGTSSASSTSSTASVSLSGGSLSACSGFSGMASSPKFHNPAFSMMGHTRLPLAVSTNSVLGCSQPMAVPSTRSTPAAVTLRLKLGTQEITYSVDEIPDPPDGPGTPIQTLTTSGKRLPTVNGHPIPLKYWPTLYKNVTGSKNQIWAKTKAHWSDWRFLMDYWEHSQNDETFWGDVTISRQNNGPTGRPEYQRDPQGPKGGA